MNIKIKIFNVFFFLILHCITFDQIIFTYLDINQEHYEELLEKSKEINGTNKARISYTRPFDYMDIRDRHEILELFFWFGFVQSKVNRN